MEVRAEAAILINADTGAILYEKNPYELHYPASTTKVATGLFVLKQRGDDLDHVVSACRDAVVSISQEAKRKSNYRHPAYWLEPDGCHIGLKDGEQMSIRDLLCGMLVVSGNDAANVLAQEVGGTIPAFMDQLNAYLKEIGCKQTTFYSPHGLHHPQHQTTAFDLALMTREALKNPTFCQIVSIVRWTRPKTNKQQATALLQSNQLLRKGALHYPKAIGVKTGYHCKAKHAFIGAARSEGRTLIAVLLACPQRKHLFEDAIKLFDAAFNQPKIQLTALQAGPQSFTLTLPHADRPITTELAEQLSVEYYPSEDPQPKCLLYWEAAAVPIEKGQRVGRVQLVAQNGTVLKEAPLYASEEVSKTMWLRRHPLLALLGGLAVLGLGLFFLRRR